MAAVVYVDILSSRIKCLNIGHVTRGLAFLLGIVMTLYSCICLYLGSVVGGAGISTLLMFGLQLCLMWLRIRDGLRSPHMPLSLEYCHENTSYLQRFPNVTSLNSRKRVQHDGSFVHISPFWSCFFSTCGTVVLGVVISLATGELKKPRASVKHLSRPLVGLWRRLGVMEAKETDQEDVRLDQLAAATLLWKDGDSNPRAIA
uniref:Uncharacterized protein n=1 Tax=Amblyomma maculatum TaxID=34609 RepID=G3MS75_AMBMU